MAAEAHYLHEYESGNKAANVCPPSDATLFPGLSCNACKAGEKLRNEPKAQIYRGWNFDQSNDDKDGNCCENSGGWITDDVSAQYSRDRA